MKIKKYRGNNEQEIMNTIKEELGSSAVVLNVKTISSNWFTRLFTNDKIEITVATDQEVAQESSGLKADMIEPDLGIDELKEKMNNMEKLLTSTADRMEDLYVSSSQKQNQKENIDATIEETGTSRSQFKNLIFEHLVRQEVEEEVATDLLKGVDDLDEEPDIKDVIRIAYNNICKTIGTINTIEESTQTVKKPKVVFFIGPTGVGKTTSIAKLTADFSLKKGKDMALITADTYRIAAIEQLRTYSEILSVPLQVVYSAKELEAGIESFKDKDFIFVDTAGRSHKNHEHLDELEDMLRMFPQKKVYLVLSATTKLTDLKSIVKRYKKLCDDFAVIITKTDETASAGTIVNLKYYTGKALSYVSFGQNVPDDIEIIDGAKYAKILLGSLGDE